MRVYNWKYAFFLLNLYVKKNDYQRKKLEFWNYLTNEKNVIRPCGLTVQRLVVIKSLALESGIWFDVILRHGAERSSAREFYESESAVAVHSRTNFWGLISRIARESIAAGIQKNRAGKSRRQSPKFLLWMKDLVLRMRS